MKIGSTKFREFENEELMREGGNPDEIYQRENSSRYVTQRIKISAKQKIERFWGGE